MFEVCGLWSAFSRSVIVLIITGRSSCFQGSYFVEKTLGPALCTFTMVTRYPEFCAKSQTAEVI